MTEAKWPQVFKDEGAFDRRTYLAQQNIDLVATLRAPELIERIGSPSPTIRTILAQARRTLRDEIDVLFADTSQVAGVFRAMLLGDRNLTLARVTRCLSLLLLENSVDRWRRSVWRLSGARRTQRRRPGRRSRATLFVVAGVFSRVWELYPLVRTIRTGILARSFSNDCRVRASAS